MLKCKDCVNMSRKPQNTFLKFSSSDWGKVFWCVLTKVIINELSEDSVVSCADLLQRRRSWLLQLLLWTQEEHYVTQMFPSSTMTPERGTPPQPTCVSGLLCRSAPGERRSSLMSVGGSSAPSCPTWTGSAGGDTSSLRPHWALGWRLLLKYGIYRHVHRHVGGGAHTRNKGTHRQDDLSIDHWNLKLASNTWNTLCRETWELNTMTSINNYYLFSFTKW